MKTFNLHFEGSILDKYRYTLPTYSGVYLVYRGTLSADGKSLHCNEIMYIGQSDNIRQRLFSHNKRTEFLQRLEEGEALFYSWAKVGLNDLDRVESTLIFHVKPELNDLGKEKFLYPSTTIHSSGACARLDRDFTEG